MTESGLTKLGTKHNGISGMSNFSEFPRLGHAKSILRCLLVLIIAPACTLAAGENRSADSNRRVPVSAVSRKQATEAEYERVQADYPDTIDGQWKLAEWCRTNHLSKQRQTHLLRILELDPDHAAARRVLGYQKHAGKWATQEEVMTGRGYVRHKGRWVLPQEVKQLENERKTTAAENQWKGTLHKWRSWLNDERAREAAEKIKAISDPFALKGLESELKVETSQPVRILYLAAVAKIGNPDALDLLVRVSLHDTAEEVRLTAIDYLAKDKQPEVIARYIQALHHKDNVIINRAALGLAAMDNPAAVPALIDALVTSHKETIVQGSPGISTTFASPNGKNPAPGVGGLSTGQSVVDVELVIKNAAVLDALIRLTGVNYDFDQVNWKAWLASRKKGQTLDARRG